MNRLQKKCFIGSAGVHLLLFVILLVGPAFLSSKEKPNPIDTQTLNYFPSKLIDEAFSGGGNRNVKPPAAAQITPPPTAPAQSKPAPEKLADPEPPKQAMVPKIDPEAVEPKTTPKPHRPSISLKVVNRTSDTAKPSKSKTADADTKAQERQVADARRRMSQQIAITAASIRENISPATTVEGDFGPGTSGPSYANYAALVRTIYENAWQEPSDTSTDDAVTKVSVTIRSDGTVLSHHIGRPSGDPQVDRSVQRTLERVTFIAPFPEGAKEKQRTYIINFNLKAKRGLA